MRNSRLVIAGVILLIGLFSYFGQQSTNPVTGEVQHVSLSQKQEIALGLQSAPEMAEQFGGLDPDPKAQELVKRVGAKLVESSDAVRSGYEFSFHVLRDPDTVNAFALPGGPIFITRALLARLKQEDQLAGVLGHEIGHVIHRHSAEHMAKSQLAQTIVGAVAVGASDEYGRGRSAAMAAAFAAQMAQLRYARKDELESDRWGVRIMDSAGYNPESMLEVMEILKNSAGGGRHPEFMSTHPDPGNRAAAIKEAIAELRSGTNKSKAARSGSY